MNGKKPTAGIILAAGMSTRLGRPKQLLQLDGKYLLEHVLEVEVENRLSFYDIDTEKDYKRLLNNIANRS